MWRAKVPDAHSPPASRAARAAAPACSVVSPLGFQSGSLPDSAFSASAEYHGAVGYTANCARLNVNTASCHAWNPNIPSPGAPPVGVKPWLQVDLGDLFQITNIQTQVCVRLLCLAGAWSYLRFAFAARCAPSRSRALRFAAG